MDSPPGGWRPPTVVSSRSASVTNRSPIQSPRAVAAKSGTRPPSPRYHNDQLRRSSSSKTSRPTTGGRAVRRSGGRTSPLEAAPVRRTNVRRSMGGMLVVLAALSTPLAGQTALGVGFAATLGSSWQIEGVDVGFTRPARLGQVRFLGVGARFAGFVDEGAIFGGTRGFISGLTLTARTGRSTLAELGDPTNVTTFGVDLTVEATGYLAANSPLPVGSRWAAVTVLPGLRFGNPGGSQFTLMIGPTFFLGHASDTRALLALRFDTPLARRGAHP